jgi:DNA primase (bacterial type)
LEYYYPGWDPPDEDDWREWIPTECPVHGDNNPSASVSYENNAFLCHACGYKGDYLSIIEQEEGCAFAEAVRRAEEIAASSGVKVPQLVARKPRRRTTQPARFGSL